MSNNNPEDIKRQQMEEAIKKAQQVGSPNKGQPTANQSDVSGNKSSEPSGIDQNTEVNEGNQQAVTGESPQSISGAQEQTAQAGKDAAGNQSGITLGTTGGNQLQQQTVNAQTEVQANQANQEAVKEGDQAPNKKAPRFNSKDLIKSSKDTVGKANLKLLERQEIHDLLAKAVESATRFERIIIKDDETKEILGSKIQYLADKDGMTVYDYAEDPKVAEHIAFVIPEDDEKDGKPVNQQVTFYWLNPQY